MRGLWLATAAALSGCWIYSEDREPERARRRSADPDAGAGGSGGDAGAGGADAPPTCQERRTSYPAGPYGASQGAVIADLSFLDTTGAPVTLQDLRADCRYDVAVVTTSAGWCTACREEQPKLQSLFDDYAEDGGLVLVTLFEDDNYEPADPELAADWQERYELTFPVLADPAFGLGAYYDRDQTPMTMLLDLETMEIRRIMLGYIDADVRSLLESLLF